MATLMNVAPDSLASAFASIVFPHPGGPKRRTPLAAPARIEELLKRLGYRRGYMIVSRSEEMMWSKPPISVPCSLGRGNWLSSAKDLPENVTWISSGCITSEAMAPMERRMSILDGV